MSTRPFSYLTGRRGHNIKHDPEPFLYSPAPARYEGTLVSAPAYYTGVETAPPVSGKIDWKETETEHVFKVELPGLKKDEVMVDLEDNRVIKVTWEKWVEREDGVDPWRRVERTCTKFVRSFRLPDDSKPHLTRASMEDSVLTIRVPREEVRMSRHGMSTRILIH